MQLAYERHWKPNSNGKGIPPVVFLHAFPVDSRMWRAQLAELGREHDVITIDFRGYGRSVAGEEPYSMELFARDVLNTLSLLDEPVSRAVFAGCSMGGYVSFEIWRQQPEAVAGLVLCDTRAEADTDDTRQKRCDQVEKIRNEGPDFLPRLMSQNVLGTTTRQQHPELVEEVKGWMGNAPAEVLIRSLQALGERRDSTPLLKEITCPTLVLVGEEDTVTPPECAERMRDAIAGARLTKVPAAGHLSPLENPDAVNSAIDTWLAETFRA